MAVSPVPSGDADMMQVLEAKRASSGAATHSPQAAALQLYAVINAQSSLVKTQVTVSGSSKKQRKDLSVSTTQSQRQ